MNHHELSKVYEPHDVEDRWMKKWLEFGCFIPGKKEGGHHYSIVIPPPNVTGSLHMGHALNSTLQDILVRYHRMKGFNTLWVVGTDHAGIATQNVVEKQLKEEGVSRFDLGREKFVERVWKWREESGGTIIGQLKRLGASCDYDNERFTMDEGLSKAVVKVFVSLHHEGLIYRGLRLINWCPRCRTALSDLEVEHEEQKGHLWHIRYPLADNSPHPPLNLRGGEGGLYLVVATTRPETLLGDTAVAVHPDDERYRNWIGKKVLLPLAQREIPVIADEKVDRDFGSGVVKITPAHDFNDFEIGRRHQLEQINILTEDGHINSGGGAYAGLTIAVARKKVVEDLVAQELLEKVEDYKNAVGHCYRCKTVVEPFLSQQWFVKAKPLAEKAITAVRNGKTRFVPQHWEKTYFNWMENIQDWCISRQIWWGHQIPAWYCRKSPSAALPSSALPAAYISSTPQSASSGRLAAGAFSAVQDECPPIVSEMPPKKCPSCGSTKLTQDPDVLDTWFSSALWPFSTLGWPGEAEITDKGEGTSPLQMFYPTSVLVTGFDIIFFWVARMMMMGLHFMNGVPPFRDIHIHALVRDPLGQKMSKSKGNVVDPLLMMKKYGTDAFRFTLASFAAQGRDIKLDEARIEGYRNFCNKIWNASRFILMTALPENKDKKIFAAIEPKMRINQWILCELSKATSEISQAIEDYEFNKGARAVYSFFWHDFCDWYLEFSKEVFKTGSQAEKEETAETALFVLDSSLRILHPFVPFITEEIWQMIEDRGESLLASASFPAVGEKTEKYAPAAEEIRLLIDAVSAIRGIRQETGVPLKTRINLKISTEAGKKNLFSEIEPWLCRLAGVDKIDFISGDPQEPSALSQVHGSLLAIPLKGLIDIDAERERLNKNLKKIEREIVLLNGKLDDEKFIQNAPEELICEKKGELEGVLEKKKLYERSLKFLSI